MKNRISQHCKKQQLEHNCEFMMVHKQLLYSHFYASPANLLNITLNLYGSHHQLGCSHHQLGCASTGIIPTTSQNIN